MKRFSVFFSFFLTTSITLFGQTYVDTVKQHRLEMDAEFADTAHSILPKTDLEHFHGLDYYDIDPEYRVEAKFKPIKHAKLVQMKTSGIKTPAYKPYGVLSFRLDGKKHKLTLYQNADSTRPHLHNYLLLAFTDKTNGFDTYGGGRYLDYKTEDVKDTMIIDFNLCYNPYCAYTDGYNCVIPPAENMLSIEIKAGVKKYHD
jgi:uncharacterized protein (DUF1684 family)